MKRNPAPVLLELIVLDPQMSGSVSAIGSAASGFWIILR